MGSYFAHARWGLDFRSRNQLEAWQKKQLARFLKEVVPKAPRYRDIKIEKLDELPYMDKSLMMADFAAGNTCGIKLDDALSVALAAEDSRDFAPLLGNLTVGLSSGTSGHRGVFLVSTNERLRWAGTLLARVLPGRLLAQLMSPWKPPLRIAFFLRANSNLYTTLTSRRIDFRFFDLFTDLTDSLPNLDSYKPDVLVAPATVLCALASKAMAGKLSIRPQHIISVAEVLEVTDAEAVLAAFDQPTHQIYQATEGFLGYTCENGTIHLNESFVHVEPDWVDKDHSRFYPVITDFSRSTQLIVRYRLNDILRTTDSPCPCGRAERSIAAIDGRSDEVIWLPSSKQCNLMPIYPDMMRRTMLLASSAITEYSISQDGMNIQIALLANPGAALKECQREISIAFNTLCQQQNLLMPHLQFTNWEPRAIAAKRRRISLINKPEGSICTS